MKSAEELSQIASTLKHFATSGDAPEIVEPLQAIKRSATEIGRAFSGSWLGYHSRVYYANFTPPPPGANFSQEWGIRDMTHSSLGSRGDWRQYDPADVKARVRQGAGSVDLTAARDASAKAAAGFSSAKLEMLSIIENELAGGPDQFLLRLKGDLEKIEALSAFEIAQIWSPKGQIMTRDTLAAGQRSQVPPHTLELADIASITQSFEVCKAGATICEKAASHLERKGSKGPEARGIGANVFIGHGRSTAWRELKEFIKDRLNLPWDEFNRVPVAGVTNISRLSEMLDDAAIAFLVMTGEDAMEDGEVQARLNVIHEAGLFQGRLGFSKAIVLAEDGCKEFSNIQGLGQIRFPKDNIAAAFEEVRRVLEREGLIAHQA